MELVYGSVCIALGIIGFVAALVESRNPHPPFWATEFIIGSILVPLVIGAVTIGLSFLFLAVLHFDRLAITLPELIGLGVIAAATLLVCKLFRIKRRLTDYAAAERQPV
jgi:ABC-type spermidine/putrescine transport system permease subunit II